MNQFHVAVTDAMATKNRGVPRKKENVESALVISDEDGRFLVEVLFTLHDEFDIEQFACEGIKGPCHDPVDVEPVAGQGHARSDDHAPY